jgi:GAF domain-containing protein
MLDVPIWSEGKMIGVVCHEHTGDFRKWNSDEENFAYLVGHTVGMLIEYTGGKLNQ